MEIIGHRGASFDAPENTLASLRLAWEQGADGVEFDVHQSRDGHIVLSHDPDTRRAAGVAGLIADRTLDELRRLDVGRWKGPGFAGECIPTLDEALATVPAGKRPLIEMKCGPAAVPELGRVLAASGLRPEQTIVISFNADAITATKAALPDVPAYWIVRLTEGDPPRTWGIDELIARAKAMRADGLDVSADPAVTPGFVRAAEAAGLPVYVWTVNDAATARRLADAGVAGIATDRPGWMREQLGW